MYIEFNKHCVGLVLKPTKRYDDMMSNVTWRVFACVLSITRAAMSPPPHPADTITLFTLDTVTPLYTLYSTERGIIVHKQELFC